MLAIVLILPLVSINMQQKPEDANWLSKPFSLLSSTIQEVFYGFSSGVKQTTAMYINLIDIKKNSEDLKSKNLELQSRLASMSDLQIENDRLRGLLDFKQSTKMELIAAQVIARDLVVDHNTLTINKGLNHGVKAGQAVITVDGVLGYIFKPTAFTAHIMLITDRYSVVDGVIQRTRSRGIVEGKAQNECVLKYVEKTEDVKQGDLVVTGGLDNIFPKGFPIATVESVERKTFSVSLKVDLRPVVDPSKVEEVFIITNAAQVDFGDKYAPVTSTETGATATAPQVNTQQATATAAPSTEVKKETPKESAQ